jgi:cold shock CspA family protein
MATLATLAILRRLCKLEAEIAILKNQQKHLKPKYTARVLLPDSTPTIVGTNISGIVKWFNMKAGYGFVTRCDTMDDVFIHRSVMRTQNLTNKIPNIGKGQQLFFDVVHVKGRQTEEAVNIVNHAKPDSGHDNLDTHHHVTVCLLPPLTEEEIQVPFQMSPIPKTILPSTFNPQEAQSQVADPASTGHQTLVKQVALFLMPPWRKFKMDNTSYVLDI